MATRLTRNLRLRIEDSLSAASIANLERLDLLGASVYIDTTDDVVVRARENIILQPASSTIGGSGTGGKVLIGTVSATVEVVINGNILPDVSTILTDSDLNGKEDYLGLPVNNGQVLKGNTDGTRFWDTLSGVVAAQNIAVSWLPSDGISFTSIHGYNTTNIEISIYDPVSATYVVPNSVDISDPNQVTLNVLEAPTGIGWKVFIREVFG